MARTRSSPSQRSMPARFERSRSSRTPGCSSGVRAPRGGGPPAALLVLLLSLAGTPAMLWGRSEARGAGQAEKPAAAQEKPAPAAATAEAAAACTDCHEDQGKSFPGNPHNRIPAAMGKEPGSAACVACHGVGTKHMESS